MSLIKLENVGKIYKTGKIVLPALREVDLSIERGEFVAIMGPSGSGKSTLLNLLGLLDRPTAGKYLLNDMEVSRLDDRQTAAVRNRLIGFVFQTFNLLPRLNAEANVALPQVYSEVKETSKSRDLLRQVGLEDRAHHHPSELSGGEQQRVAIARALVNHPRLILADEPTGNLDSRAGGEIVSLIRDLNRKGITVIMVTHEEEIARAAERILFMRDGKIVSDQRSRERASRAGEMEPEPPPPRRRSLIGSGRIREYFSQAARSLLASKARSFLSVLGVLIGVASVIAMLALGRGAQDDVSQRISSLGSNLLFVRASSPRLGGIAMESGASVRFYPDDAVAVREDIPGVKAVVPYVSGRGQVVWGGRNWNTRVEGTNTDYPEVRNSRPDFGRFFTEREMLARDKVAVIGRTLVRELFGDENPLGQFVKIRGVDFQVIGVLPEKGSSGWRDEDDKVVVPLSTAMHRLLGRDYIDSMDVQVTEVGLMEDVSERIKQLITRRHRLPATRGESIDVRNLADLQETIAATARTFTYLLGSIALVSLLVGGIGIMNIMLVSVTERTREIGLRKAIGANRGDILCQFVLEAVAICGIGGVLGIFLGTAASFALARLAEWTTRVTSYSVALAFFFSVAVGLLFGIWPARKASKLDPIEALRHE